MAATLPRATPPPPPRLAPACALKQLRHPPLLGALADRLSQRAVLPGLAPPQAVAVAAAYAALGVRQPHLLDRLALRLLQPEARPPGWRALAVPTALHAWEPDRSNQECGAAVQTTE